MKNKPDILRRVKDQLNNLRPYLHADGGDIELLDLSEDYVVTVKLLGACRTCSMSAMTMKAGVEDGIKKAVPEVRQVVAVEE